MERLRQVEMMADRESESRQLELAAQTVMARLRGHGDGVGNKVHVWLPPSQKFNIPEFSHTCHSL